MLANKIQRPTIGTCEVCDPATPNIETWLGAGNIRMCKAHYTEEQELVAKSTKVIADSRKIDSGFELKPDIYNAQTVSIVELEAAIQNNPEIPESRKHFALMQEVAARLDKLNAVIFAEDAALTAKKNERHALTVQAQNIAAKLHESERAQFQKYDVNYKPEVKKEKKEKVFTTKPAAPKRKSFDKAALYAACKKYGVPAPGVQMILASKPNMTEDDAAKQLAGIMGLPTTVN